MTVMITTAYIVLHSMIMMIVFCAVIYISIKIIIIIIFIFSTIIM